MINVYLLKEYSGHGASEIINVNKEIAKMLIKQGIARKCINRDFLIKPKFGETKAFKRSPINK